MYPSIHIDFGSKIGPNCRIVCVDGGKMKIYRSSIRRESTVFCDERGYLELDRCVIGEFNNITAKEDIRIGENTLIDEFVTIRDQNDKFESGIDICHSGFETAPIHIERNVWIGNKVTILKGVRVAEGIIVAANAVLNPSTDPHTVYGGVSAKCLKKY